MKNHTTTDTFTHIGELIAYLRNKKGLSQLELSEGVCSREYLVKIEKCNQYPTSYIINGLCDKLGIDIYEEYSLILRHGGFERHTMITEFNDCYSKENCKHLPDLIAKCEQQFSQIDGELYQHLCYAKSICALDLENNLVAARNHALQGIVYKHPNYSLESPLTDYTLSNIDLQLIYYYMNSLCEQGTNPNAVLAYINVYEHLKNLLDTNHYVIHKMYHFEINMLTAVVVNMVFYNMNTIPLRKLYDIVCDVLKLKKIYNYSDSLPNLLFEKCYLCRKLGYSEEYEATLTTAIAMGEFYLGKEQTQLLKEWMLTKE